jgi:hypothetical protein
VLPHCRLPESSKGTEARYSFASGSRPHPCRDQQRGHRNAGLVLQRSVGRILLHEDHVVGAGADRLGAREQHQVRDRARGALGPLIARAAREGPRDQPGHDADHG